MEWSADKEKKILTKYRFTLTVRVIRIIAAILFLFWLYMLVLTMSYDGLEIGKKHAFYSKVAMDWTLPNMYEDHSFDTIEITPFLTQKISYPVYKLIGKELEYVGDMKVSNRLVKTYSTRNIDYTIPKQGEEYAFYLPESPFTGSSLSANEKPGTWTKLEKVHEGTVAELFFSTKVFMEPEELLNLLEPYDLDVLWMPLYTGELKEFEVGRSESGGSLSLSSIFGFTGGREASQDYNSRVKYGLEDASVDQNKNIMLSSMNRLLENESRSYYENVLGLDHLEERYHYLKEHGFSVYGAVVTGPVKELLKLKEVEQIQGARLGEMSYWNWSE